MKTPHICLWKDLSTGDIESLERAESAEEVHRVLSGPLCLEVSVCPLRAAALLDLHHYTLRFCRHHKLRPQQTSRLLAIIQETHRTCTGTSLGNVEECYRYFKELLLCHTVQRPPFSMAVFTQPQLQLISDYFTSTYFRHFKLYKQVFTPQAHLDLSVSTAEDSHKDGGGPSRSHHVLSDRSPFPSSHGEDQSEPDVAAITAGAPPAEDNMAATKGSERPLVSAERRGLYVTNKSEGGGAAMEQKDPLQEAQLA